MGYRKKLLRRAQEKQEVAEEEDDSQERSERSSRSDRDKERSSKKKKRRRSKSECSSRSRSREREKAKRVVVEEERDQDHLLRIETLENVTNPGISDPEADQNPIEDTASGRDRGHGLLGNIRRSVIKFLFVSRFRCFNFIP